MKKTCYIVLMTALALINVGCSSNPQNADKGPSSAVAGNSRTSALDNDPSVKKMKVRLTVYWANGKGTDRWSRKMQSSTGEQLVSSKSAAVDPKVITYGSKIIVPEIGHEFVAMDTGSAVISRKASRRDGNRCPVVDIFFKDKNEALKWASNNPSYVTVYINTPEG